MAKMTILLILYNHSKASEKGTILGLNLQIPKTYEK